MRIPMSLFLTSNDSAADGMRNGGAAFACAPLVIFVFLSLDCATLANHCRCTVFLSYILIRVCDQWFVVFYNILV